MHDGVVLALDLGWSWCKALALGADGRVVASARRSSATPDHDLAASGRLLENQWETACSCLSEVAGALSGRRPVALGVTAAAHIGLCLDGDGRPFAQPRLWHPPAELSREVESHGAWSSGGALCHGYQAPLTAQLLWLRRNEPGWHARIRRVGGMHSYLLWRLTGQWVTDAASGPGLFDWPRALFELGGVGEDALPRIAPGEHVAGPLRTEVARSTGLPAGLPVAVGGHDGACASMGAHAWRPGDCCFTLATNWVPRTVSGDALSGSFGYPVRPGAWAWAWSVPWSGRVIDLLVAGLAGHASAGVYAQLEADAREVGDELPDLGRLPEPAALAGEANRARELVAAGWRPGAIYLAGVRRSLAALLDHLERARAAGAAPVRFSATGGFSQSRVLVSELATLLDAPVTLAADEASARGAAAYAAVAGGWFASVDDALRVLAPPRGEVRPPARQQEEEAG